MRSRIRYPILLVIPLSLLLGTIWGLRLKSESEARLRGQAQMRATIKVLSFKDLLPADLIRRFESESRIRVEVIEKRSPEELWEHLEKMPNNAPSNAFDLVMVFSHQVPLAVQMARIQPIDPKRLKNLNSVAPDFRELNGDRSFNEVVPLLWGITGVFYNSKRLGESGQSGAVSWANLIRDPLVRGQIGMAASTTEIARLGAPSSEPKDIKKAVQHLLLNVQMAPDFLSPVALFNRKNIPAAVLVSHGETGFPPLAQLTDWKFVVPDEKGALWTLNIALHHEATSSGEAYEFIDFLLERDASLSLARNYRQASTNREIEATDVNAKIKPSYLRQVPLSKIIVWKDFSRSREIRQLVPLEMETGK